MPDRTQKPDINVITIRRGEQTFVFLFDDPRSVEILRQAGRWAVDPQNPFSWYDAAVLSRKIRKLRFPGNGQ